VKDFVSVAHSFLFLKINAFTKKRKILYSNKSTFSGPIMLDHFDRAPAADAKLQEITTFPL
jgi:hypothetical protein